MAISRRWSRMPARRQARAAPSSPPTPWRRCRRRSASRCPIRPARRRPTNCATGSRRALETPATVVAATGGSTNAALHLPAIAHECGIAFDLFDVAEVFKRTPYIADLKPGGRYVAKDLFEAGGVPLLMKTLLDHGFLHGECMTLTGRSVAENMKGVVWNDQQDVVRPADRPLLATGGVV